MKPENFDKAIDTTFEQYGLGVDVKLLSVQDRAASQSHNYIVSVTVEVAPVTPQMIYHADTWHYSGEAKREKEKAPVPLGVRPINRKRLIKATDAASRLPPGFPLPDASCSLFWPVTPEASEPLFAFQVQDTVINIGGYSGKTLSK